MRGTSSANSGMSGSSARKPPVPKGQTANPNQHVYTSGVPTYSAAPRDPIGSGGLRLEDPDGRYSYSRNLSHDTRLDPSRARAGNTFVSHSNAPVSDGHHFMAGEFSRYGKTPAMLNPNSASASGAYSVFDPTAYAQSWLANNPHSGATPNSSAVSAHPPGGSTGSLHMPDMNGGPHSAATKMSSQDVVTEPLPGYFGLAPNVSAPSALSGPVSPNKPFAAAKPSVAIANPSPAAAATANRNSAVLSTANARPHSGSTPPLPRALSTEPFSANSSSSSLDSVKSETVSTGRGKASSGELFDTLSVPSADSKSRRATVGRNAPNAGPAFSGRKSGGDLFPTSSDAPVGNGGALQRSNSTLALMDIAMGFSASGDGLYGGACGQTCVYTIAWEDPNGLGRSLADVQALIREPDSDKNSQARTLVVTIKGKDGIVPFKLRRTPGVTDPSRTSYDVGYSPTLSGTHEIFMSYHGIPIPGSPFRAAVKPGPFSASFSTLSFAGGQEQIAGEDMRVLLLTKDAYGNAATIDPAKNLRISFRRRSSMSPTSELVGDPILVKIEDAQDGSMNLISTLNLIGCYELRVVDAAGGQDVKGSPKNMICRAGPVFPGNCVCSWVHEGSSLKCKIGDVMTAHVVTKDQFGNPAFPKGKGMTPLMAELRRNRGSAGSGDSSDATGVEEEEEVDSNVIRGKSKFDVKKGLFEVQFKMTGSGEYRATVTYMAAPLSHNLEPVMVTAPPPPVVVAQPVTPQSSTVWPPQVPPRPVKKGSRGGGKAGSKRVTRPLPVPTSPRASAPVVPARPAPAAKEEAPPASHPDHVSEYTQEEAATLIQAFGRGRAARLRFRKKLASARERKSAALKLYEGEVAYGKTLAAMKQSYIEPMRSKNVLSADQLADLFGNVESLRSLSSMLESRWRSLLDDFSVWTGFAAPFLDAVQSIMECNKKYASSIGRSIRSVQHMRANEPGVETFLVAAEKSLTGRFLVYGSSLEDLLRAPMKRTSEYVAGLRRYTHYTPSWAHDETAAALAALNAAVQLSETMDAAAAQADQLERMAQLQESIQGLKLHVLMDGRRLLREGLFSFRRGRSAKQPRYVILFSDVLLLCKPTKKKIKVGPDGLIDPATLKFAESVELRSCYAKKDISDDCMVRIVMLDVDSGGDIDLMADASDVAAAWFAAIQRQVQALTGTI